MVKHDFKRRTNLRTAYIDGCKAYGTIAHWWIIEFLYLVGIARNVACFIKCVVRWTDELRSYGKFLVTLDIRRGIFQCDSLSLLLFVLCMIYLTWSLKKINPTYQRKEKPQIIMYPLFVDDLKL